MGSRPLRNEEIEVKRDILRLKKIDALVKRVKELEAENYRLKEQIKNVIQK